MQLCMQLRRTLKTLTLPLHKECPGRASVRLAWKERYSTKICTKRREVEDPSPPMDAQDAEATKINYQPVLKRRLWDGEKQTSPPLAHRIFFSFLALCEGSSARNHGRQLGTLTVVGNGSWHGSRGPRPCSSRRSYEDERPKLQHEYSGRRFAGEVEVGRLKNDIVSKRTVKWPSVRRVEGTARE